ncbi:Corticotropin-releasing factor receptor 1 [Holothuria leucospilota]|uniref:Corticotropin-releasing factor receptor 1 n=1 Tax=Holothuria leucospilota TaxID=206669 RepID=A0A9Q0YL31_HOLLE|nr:Corticotropin-releasing factor receptor 1 [Holothuria leucospilota]
MSVYEVRTSDHHDNQGDHSCPKDCEDFDYGQILCWPETDNGTLVEIGCPITPFTDHTILFWCYRDIPDCGADLLFYILVQLTVSIDYIRFFQPFLCGGLFAVNEYFTLCAFAWMFVEGLYLNTLISSSVFGRHNFIRYYIIAWVLPGPFVLMWVVFMILTAEGRCWPLHTESLYYLILIEIPRDFLFILNSIFLLHIIYVLVTKLQNNNSGETQVIRKAVKAFFVLLPLLGISNLLWCLPQPKPGDHSAVIVIFYYGMLFVYSSQGFAVAMLFCFLNKEVRVLIKRKWRIWVNFMDAPMRRTSVITSTSDVSTRSNGNHRLPRPGSSTFDSVTMPGSTTFETLA